MTVVIAPLLGWVVGVLALHALSGVLRAPVLQRSNYRGHQLATGAGIVIVVSAIVGAAGAALVGAVHANFAVLDGVSAAGIAPPAVLLSVLGFGCLGMIDDLLFAGDDRGFRGHLRALSAGRLSTGAIKLLGGAALALTLASHRSSAPGNRLAIVTMDAVIIALSANLGNLLDRAPGRTLKASMFGFGLVATAAVLGHTTDRLGAVGFVIGAGAALLHHDLCEHSMLGDTGANPLGAVLGLAACATLSVGGRLVVLALTAGLNGLSEVVSFSKLIEKVGPLRWLDLLGVLPERRAGVNAV